MPVIGSNVASLFAQSNRSSGGSVLSQSIEILSRGSPIATRDMPSGAAVSSRILDAMLQSHLKNSNAALATASEELRQMNNLLAAPQGRSSVFDETPLTQSASRSQGFGADDNSFQSVIERFADGVLSPGGRVRDFDFGQDTGSMTKNQILQQAGTAMISQANAQPQSVLKALDDYLARAGGEKDASGEQGRLNTLSAAEKDKSRSLDMASNVLSKLNDTIISVLRGV